MKSTNVENYFVLSCANASSQVYVMYIVYMQMYLWYVWMLIQLHVTKQYACPMDIAHAVVLALANIYVHRTCDTHVCEYMYFAI